MSFNNNAKRGLLVLISGPSGVGKGTIVSRIIEERSDCRRSVSATTRSPRQGEVEGQSYFFLDRETFLQRRATGYFLESDEHFNNWYGTPKQFVEEQRVAGVHIILEIDVVGATEVMKLVPDAVSIFIAPPNLQTLQERLHTRGTETEAQIANRLERIRHELSYQNHYTYTVINDDLDTAVQQVNAIFEAEMLKNTRRT